MPAGETIGEVLDGLVATYPALEDQLFTEDGELNRFVNVYLNGQDVRYLDGRATAVDDRRRGPAPPRDGGRVTGDRSAPVTGRYESILEAIGHTPLVEIPRMCPNPAVRLYAKLEMAQPDGVREGPRGGVPRRGPRAARRPRPGLDHPRAHVRQHRDRARDDRAPQGLPRRARHARQRDRRAAPGRGAVRREIIDSPGAERGSNGAIALAKELAAADPRYVMPYQYGNPANPQAHYETTGPEILADCPEIDVFVAGLGTSGTLMGVGRYLREHKPGVRIVAAEPLPGENVQGLRSLEEGFVPEILDPSVLDAKYLVSNRDAVAALRDLVAREGVFAGPSCGAVLVAAAREAQRMDARDDRGAAPRRRLEVPLGRHVRARPRRDGGRPRGRGELVVIRGEASLAPGAGDGPPAARAGRGDRGPGPGRVPERGLRDHRRHRGRRRRRHGAPLRAPAATCRPPRTATRSTRTTRSGSSVETDDADEVVWGIVHSHVKSPAVPSPTDVGLAAFYPDALYLLVSLAADEADASTGEPSLRAWRIVDGRHLRGRRWRSDERRRPRRRRPSTVVGVAWLLAGARRAGRRHAARLERHAAGDDRHAAGRSIRAALVGCQRRGRRLCCIVRAVRRLGGGTRRAVRGADEPRPRRR